MLFFAHLFLGAAIGLIILKYTHDKRAIITCIIGSGISDLVDKPIGYIYPMLDSGRTVFHTLAVFITIFAISIIIWKRWHNTLFIPFAIGILLHQITDTMWITPYWWYWPFGRIVEQHYINPAYFTDFFTIEITSLSEWIFGIMIAILIIQKLKPLYSVSLVAIIIMGSYSLWAGITNAVNLSTPYLSPDGNIVLGLVSLAGATLIILSNIFEYRILFNRISCWCNRY